MKSGAFCPTAILMSFLHQFGSRLDSSGFEHAMKTYQARPSVPRAITHGRLPLVRFECRQKISGVDLTQGASNMAAEPRRAPIMTLQQLVAKYQSLAGGFGIAVPLSAFGLSKAETEQLLTDYDEDYH